MLLRAIYFQTSSSLEVYMRAQVLFDVIVIKLEQNIGICNSDLKMSSSVEKVTLSEEMTFHLLPDAKTSLEKLYFIIIMLPFLTVGIHEWQQ